MSSGSKKKVFVGMSGGVDSSVAAYLLKEQGFEVIGVFINGYNVDGCAERDAEEARRAAEHIGIPFYALDLREAYFERVVQYMISEYERGRTPNPDVMCNKEIKFGVFLKKALKLGADYIATGHYIKIQNLKIKNQNDPSSRTSTSSVHYGAGKLKFKTVYKLFQAKDLNKDQSYFLWTLTQEQLKHCLFPIGGYTKAEVREIARRAGLPNAERKDSQGICFLGQIKLPDFLERFIEPKKGDVIDTEGNKVGEHEGVQFYTIGQRRMNVNFQFPTRPNGHSSGRISNFQTNSKIKNQKSKISDRRPYYVVLKDAETNMLVVAEGDDNPALFKKEVWLENVHFISHPHWTIRPNCPVGVMVRVRYRQELVEAVLRKSEIRNQKSEKYQMVFAKPVKFVAPGQSAVFYSEISDECGGREMLGGGVISE